MSWLITGTYKGAAVSDPDAQAYLRAVEQADNQGPLEQGVQQAVNQFVIGCKADGIWNAIKASCILAGARTLTGALVPLVGAAPTRHGTEAGWNYSRKLGLAGNGVNNYLNTKRANDLDSQNDKHLAVNLATAMTGTVAIIGSQTLSPVAQSFILTSGGLLDTRLNSTTSFAPTTSSLSGFIGVSRSLPTTLISRSASTTTSGSNNSTTPNSLETFVFARNLDGSASIHTAARASFYSIGKSLNLALLDARVTTLINAFDAAI